MSSFNITVVKSLLKKEFIEHKVAFLYVPGILVGLMFMAFFVAVWRNSAKLDLLKNTDFVVGGIDLFNVFFTVSIAVWLGYLTLMLFFYFASSFSADRKNNALLFWKSMPVSDLQIMGTKTLAGYTVFPIVIMGWALVTAVFGVIAVNALGAISPFVASLNSGTSLWAFINVEISSLVFMVTALLWYLPLFAFVGLLGTLLRAWAVPAFVLIITMISAFESIVTFSQEGAFIQLLENRFNAPYEIIGNMIEKIGPLARADVMELVAIFEFVPTYLSQIDWTGMVAGWAFAAICIYLASEYRRRRLAA